MSSCKHAPVLLTFLTYQNFPPHHIFRIGKSSALGFPGGSVAKNLPSSAEDAKDAGLIPGSGRSPEGGNSSPLRYSSLENPMDIGTWRATVQRV